MITYTHQKFIRVRVIMNADAVDKVGIGFRQTISRSALARLLSRLALGFEKKRFQKLSGV